LRRKSARALTWRDETKDGGGNKTVGFVSDFGFVSESFVKMKSRGRVEDVKRDCEEFPIVFAKLFRVKACRAPQQERGKNNYVFLPAYNPRN